MASVVPFNDLSRIHAPLHDELMRAIDSVIRSNSFILGPSVAAFEEAYAKACEADHVIGVSSGTDALLATLMALGIGTGDEVIVSSYSFIASASVIQRVGATPVFADIDPVSFNVTPETVERHITKRTRAIIAVHLFGRCAPTEALQKLVAGRDIEVIEDAAQAHLATHASGQRAGTRARVGCFSFFPAKNLGAFGDAGAITTSDAELAATLRVIRQQGSKPKYYHRIVGGNFRLDALQAAVLRIKLAQLEAWTEQRRANAAHFHEELAGLAEEGRIALPEAGEGRHVFNQFVVRTTERDALREHLADAGVQTAIYYPLPLHQQECFAPVTGTAPALPNSEAASRETLALPVFPGMTTDELARVVAAVRSFMDRTPRAMAPSEAAEVVVSRG